MLVRDFSRVVLRRQDQARFRMLTARGSKNCKHLLTAQQSEDRGVEIEDRRSGSKCHGVDLIPQFTGEFEEGKWLLRRILLGGVMAGFVVRGYRR